MTSKVDPSYKELFEMTMPNFEEKQFEFACNIELAFQNRAIFPIGQVLESICGYDVAAWQPNNSPIWQILNVVAPQGAVLNPANWPPKNNKPVTLPAHHINIILQYKRSEFCGTQNYPQWNLWNANYYRYDVRLPSPNRFRQFQRLLDLENTLGTNALVFYAAPVFHQYASLLVHQLNSQVLAHSNFAKPSLFNNHARWTFNQTGTAGIPNPSGDRHSCPTFKQIMKTARQQSRRCTIFTHLRTTAKRLGIKRLVDQTPPDWVEQVRKFVKSKKKLQAIHDAVTIANRIGNEKAVWFVVQFN